MCAGAGAEKVGVCFDVTAHVQIERVEKKRKRERKERKY